MPCHLRDSACAIPSGPQTRQVAFFEKNQGSPLQYTERMKQAIDSDRGRKLYGRRIAIVEPVFANLRHNKRLDRFTLRTQPKVNTQWNLYCMVHNIEKLAHHGYGSWRQEFRLRIRENIATFKSANLFTSLGDRALRLRRKRVFLHPR